MTDQGRCAAFPSQLSRTKTARTTPAITRASTIAEAQRLVRRSAEPRPVGDSVKQAINRASRRLGFDPGRTRKLWYGNTQRVDAHEMDLLRSCAAAAQLDGAVESLKGIRTHLSARNTPESKQIIAGIDATLRALDNEQV
jgi:hypothetical protein